MRESAEEKSRFAIDIPTPYGRLQTEFVFSGSEIGLSEFAGAALAMGEKILGMMTAAKALEGRTVSCAKGCAACCRQVVAVSPPEALLLAEQINSWPEERRESVRRRFVSAKAKYAASGLEERIRTPEAKADGGLAFALGYHRLGIDCPFLENETCTVHAHRPFGCRNYLVSSPASLCSDLKPGSGIKPMKIREHVAGVLAALSAELLGVETHMLLLLDLADWSGSNRPLARRRFPAAQLTRRFLELWGKSAENKN